MSGQIADGTLKREYVAVAEGRAKESDTLRDILLKDEAANMVRVVPSYLKQGKEAVLSYRSAGLREEQSLVAIKLETGRAHQIRVQLAHAGLPLWGDNRYGKGRPGQQIALWGMRLSLLHPITGRQMVFVAPPDDRGIWTEWRKELEGLEAIWPQIVTLG